MTERKPREMTFASWVDRQVSEAEERGAFDNLPGAGKPISRRGGTDAWLQDYLRREGVSADELLPTPLRLRKEIERLTETVQDLRSEDEVREVVKGLNRRIAEWRRIPDGPPVYLRLVDEDAMVTRWRDARAAAVRPRPRPAARTLTHRRAARAGGAAAPGQAQAGQDQAGRVRPGVMPARRRPAGWRSARRPAAPRRRGRGRAGRCRRRPRG